MACNLKVKCVLNLYNCRNKYRRQCIKQDIRDDLENNINTNKFKIKDNGKLYCNIFGAKIIADWLNVDFSIYAESIAYLNSNKRLRESKRDLNVLVKLTYDDNPYMHFSDEYTNKYLSNLITSMCLNGKMLDEIDTNTLADRDIETLNSAVNKFNNIAKAGHNEQSYRIMNTYKYINDTDPDICKRALYYFDYDEIDINEQYMKLRHLDYCIELEKALRVNRKKANKRMKNKKNQKLIDEICNTQYSDNND